MPTAPLQVSHLSGLQPPLSQACQCYWCRCCQPNQWLAACQPNQLSTATSQMPMSLSIGLRLIPVTITFLLQCGCVSHIVSHVSLMSHFAFHVSDVSHVIWLHTLQTISVARCHVSPDLHIPICHICRIVTILSHWLVMFHIWLNRHLSCGSNLSRVLVTILILFGQILILLIKVWSFWSDFDDKPTTAQVISIARWKSPQVF